MRFLLFLQSPTPEQIVASVPEKMPALVTLIYLGGFLLIAIVLLISLFLNRRKSSAPTAAVPADLPKEVRRRLGSTSTNRGLRGLRCIFILHALSILGIHVYWTRYAP